MPLDASSSWANTDMDTSDYHSHASGFDNPSDWDGFFDLKENIDVDSSLGLLQEPFSSSYEPQDEWLVEFGRLQDVYNRAINASDIAPVPGISPVRYQKKRDNLGASRCTRADNSNGLCNGRLEKKASPSPYCSCDTSPKVGKPVSVTDATDRASLIPMRCSSPTNGQGSSEPNTAIRTSVLYGWNPNSSHDTQQALGAGHVERAIEGLRTLQETFRVDTKRRKSQVQQSRSA